MIFPRINPSVIVAVTHGDYLLLTQYANRPGATRTALIAGFTEFGETAEQTVHREVMEEVGLKIKNLRYYKSQPWGISGGGCCSATGASWTATRPSISTTLSWRTARGSAARSCAATTVTTASPSRAR